MQETLGSTSAKEPTMASLVPLGGKLPSEMTDSELAHVNRRWEWFFREKRWVLENFARGDEDAVSIGLLSVRGTLCKYPNCPTSWLVQRAKLDILKQADIGKLLGSPKWLFLKRKPRESDDRFRQQSAVREEEKLEFEALQGQDFEAHIYDKLQYEEFWNDLTEMEQKLVKLLKEEKGDPPRWYKSEYVKVPHERKKGQARKRFYEEVSPSVKDYLVAYAHVRFKFYLHFGTEEEISREREWLEKWQPCQSLHASRNGKCKRKGSVQGQEG